MGLFKPATNQSAFLKMGIQGFGGAGKTRTASNVAIGLHRYIKAEKPVAFMDTETGSDFVLPQFKAAGVPLVALKSRAFVDLMNGTREAEKDFSIVIVDSITHFWDELLKAYIDKREKKKLRIWDWAPIKQEWRQYTELYINSKVHIIMCGRAGWVYGDREDEDGVTETTKVGTKMKVETDMNFEPSLLVEMELHRPKDAEAIGTKFVNRAWVLKDRFDQINGKCFEKPTFESFLPHIKNLNLGGEHVGVDLTSNSQALFDGPNSRMEWQKRREILCEEIMHELLLRWPGQSADEKKQKAQTISNVFQTGSWTAVQEKSVEELEGGLCMIREIPLVPEAAVKADKKEKK